MVKFEQENVKRDYLFIINVMDGSKINCFVLMMMRNKLKRWKFVFV